MKLGVISLPGAPWSELVERWRSLVELPDGARARDDSAADRPAETGMPEGSVTPGVFVSVFS